MSSVDSPPGVPVSYRQQYRRCGKAACSRCAAGGRGHGPYWYAFWTEGGRARSRYVGKQAPAGVDPTPVAASDAEQGALDRAASEALRVRTLGGFAVWRGKAALGPETWSNQRAAHLFKCLLGAPGYRLPREQAIELLWPEVEPEAGAANLRTTMHRLRLVLDVPSGGASHLRLAGDVLALAPAGDAAPAHDWLDAAVFARAARTALAVEDADACRAALACYGGEYLPDDRYAAWAEPLRAELSRQYVALLLHLAALSGARGDLEEAEDCLRRVLSSDPSHEEAAATLMGLLASSGRRWEALRVYQGLATVLETDLAVAPSAEVTALRARLVAQEAAPVAAVLRPARGGPPRPTNVPAALSSFVGRVWEVSAVAEALSMARLVTLTGPGGCGKTRLALELAERLVDAERYPDGVWLVELAALADPLLVLRAAARALGVAEQSGQTLLDTLIAFLASRRMLLVLDNCEHLVAACAGLATDLLRSCPHLSVLATSREALALDAEHFFLVPPLAVPDPADLPTWERLSAYDGVHLFLERAQARQPGFTLTAANASAVARICARMDGLPLAIELAAAWLGALPVERLAERLDDGLRLLRGGPRTALPRQQALRATIDWSYHLLSEPERALLRRLAAFRGGCTAAAAEAVCHRANDLGVDVRAGLSSLVGKSLLRQGGAEGGTRFGMLETIRAYGLEHLLVGGEAAEVRRRHAAYYLALAEEAAPELTGASQGEWLARLDRELDNVRAALEWMREHADDAAVRDGEWGLRLAAALEHFWETRRYLTEARGWLHEFLGRATPPATAAQAHALSVTAALAYDQGDLNRSLALRERSLALYGELGDPAGTATALTSMGAVLLVQGDYARAVTVLEDALALRRELGDRRGISAALNNLGNVAQAQGDYARAIAAHEESLAIKRELGDTLGVAKALGNLGNVVSECGDYARARALHEESMALQRALGDVLGTAISLLNLGAVTRKLGDAPRARTLVEESLALMRDLDHRWGIAECLEGLASITLTADQPDVVSEDQAAQAARFLGAAETLRVSAGATARYGDDVIVFERTTEAARRVLGAGGFAAAWATGQALPLEHIVTEALEDAGPVDGSEVAALKRAGR